MIRLLLFCTATILVLTAAPSVGGYFDPPPGVGDGHYTNPPSYNYGGAGPCPINIPRCHDTPRQQRPVQVRPQRIKQPWR
jgi:hypothetical protein